MMFFMFRVEIRVQCEIAMTKFILFDRKLTKTTNEDITTSHVIFPLI